MFQYLENVRVSVNRRLTALLEFWLLESFEVTQQTNCVLAVTFVDFTEFSNDGAFLFFGSRFAVSCHSAQP